jgi:very-short-patch-repair endonuclease
VQEKFGRNAPGDCDATDAELALWRRLRSRSLDGHKFVRQEPVGPYTVDFICREARLIIEVDGGQHADNRHDVVRDQWLTSHNYRVLRFWNNDVLGNVLGNVVGVLETIATALADSPPHPPRI